MGTRAPEARGLELMEREGLREVRPRRKSQILIYLSLSSWYDERNDENKNASLAYNFASNAAALKYPALLRTSHGVSVIILPFDSSVHLVDYLPLCCDASPNPGPTINDLNCSRVQVHWEVAKLCCWFAD